MKIWANTIVQNEENFVWFALMSVINYVDKILVWDSGSTDKTVEIIKTINSEKIMFKEVGEVDPEEFTKMRQKMLLESDCDWILILDGDEIWWEESIKKLVREIKNKQSFSTNKNTEGIVVPMKVPVGDIYHIQEEEAGKYKILGKTGHFSLKAFNKNIPGLHADWPYGKEGFFDGEGKLIQEREKIVFVDAPFLHVTHLKRSNSKRIYNKFKYELGDEVGVGFKFPEALYSDYPKIISSPWARISGAKLLKAKILTPLRKIKRAVV